MNTPKSEEQFPISGNGTIECSSRTSHHVPSTTFWLQKKRGMRPVLLLPTCVRRSWGGGLYDCGAVIRHAELASSLGVQRGEWGERRRARPSVPPIGPPRELQVQGLVQGQHGHNPLTSHLHKQSQRGRVKPRGASEGQLGFHATTHTAKCNDRFSHLQ